MAVNGNLNFQRRNVGVLADTPDFQDVGQSAYVDYAAAQGSASPSAMSVAVAEAEASPEEQAPVAPTGASQTPQAMVDYEAAQRAFIERSAIAAERKAKAAGNPLNMIGSVLGTPVKLLANILGGQNDLTSPFTPKQNYQDRMAEVKAVTSAQLLTLAQKTDGYTTSTAKAIADATTNKGELIDDLYSRLSNAALNAKRMGPNASSAFERSKSAIMANPVFSPLMQDLGLDELPWNEGLAAELAFGKDVQARLDESRKVTNNVTPYGSTITQTDADGKLIGVIQQDGSISTPTVSSVPTEDMPSLEDIDAAIERKIQAQAPPQPTDGVTMPEPPPPVGETVQKVISAEEYARMETALGPQGAQNWMRENNIQGVAN